MGVFVLSSLRMVCIFSDDQLKGAMNTKSKLSRAAAWFLSLNMAVLPLHSYVHAESVNSDDFISQIGREGQFLGRELAREIVNTPAKVQGGQIQMPVRGEDGSLQYDGSMQIDVNTLYPGSNPSNSDLKNQFFTDGLEPSVGELEGIYDSDSSMVDRGEGAQASLWDDAYSDSPSISGAAYKVIIDSANLSRPDFKSDPMMRQTFDVYDNIDLIAEGFGDCSAEDVFTDISMNVHKPQYETCEKLDTGAGGCTIRNDIRVSSQIVDVYVAGRGRVWLTVEFDLKTGSWKTINPTDGIAWNANIPVLDYNEVCQGGKFSYTDFVGAWDWIHHGLGGKIDSTVWYRSLENPSCENGLVGVVQIQDTKTGSDVDYVLGGRMRFRLNTLIGNEWSSDSCIQAAKRLGDGFCEGGLTITGGATTDAECVNVNGLQICPGDPIANAMSESPLPGVPKLATEVQVSDIQCNFNIGPMDCWTDINGIEQCPVNEGGITNSCEDFESNPQCGFISSSCVEGAKGASGICYVQEEVWDCGSSVAIDTVEKSTKYQCAGAIRCMGADCLDPTQTTNQTGNFAKASALLNAAQFMTQDMVCSEGATSDGGDGNVDEGCSAFGGEAGECKIAVGGVQDCCEKPSNVSLADYLRMIRMVPKMDGAVLALEGGSADVVASAYKTIRDPVVNSFSEVTKPFTGYMDNVSGAVSDFFSPLTELKDQLIGQLKEQAKQIFQDTIGNLAQDAATEAAVSAGAEQATEAARDAMAENAMSMLGGAMTIYTYYQVAIAVIQMVWACEQEELEMNSKRAVDSCTYVGSYCATKVLGQCIEKRESYCCFNSPLSRIIQEQVRPQLGWTFGSPKNPNCNGIPLDRIGEIDWDRVNLDEWLAILAQNGMFPTADGIGMDSLTGSGSAFNISGDRLPADERALERLEGIDVDAKRREVMEGIEFDPRGR